MSKTTSWTIGILIVIIATAAGAYLFFSKPVAAPSTDLATLNTALSENTNQILSTASGANMIERFQIDNSRSLATFRIFEVLRGEDFTVVGTTSEVAGNIIVDRQNVAASSAGQIVVNARTLKTDSAQRDGAIARLILKSEDDANEFIRFTPTNIAGLPATGVEGTNYPLQITGDLEISGVKNNVRFDADVIYTTDNMLQITAKTAIQRPDFNLVVPNLPFLANVSDTVEIELTLVAAPAA